jgi:hypothetical protein
MSVDLVLAGDGGGGLSGLDPSEDAELEPAGEPSTLLGHGFSLLCLMELNSLSQIRDPAHSIEL